MKPRRQHEGRRRRRPAGAVAGWLSVISLAAPASGEADAVSAAMLTYGPGAQTGRCFSDGFLTLAERESSVRVERHMPSVALGSDGLFAHPFAVMTGEGSFDLSEDEAARLGRYLRSGGFLLASAGCTSDAWAASMERAIERALPGAALVELPPDHPVFHALFDVQEFISRKRQPVRLLGIEIEGRLVLLYSPQGLNDTNEVGGMLPDGGQPIDAAAGDQKSKACCCCNGDEIVSARYINANALVYALVQ